MLFQANTSTHGARHSATQVCRLQSVDLDTRQNYITVTYCYCPFCFKCFKMLDNVVLMYGCSCTYTVTLIAYRRLIMRLYIRTPLNGGSIGMATLLDTLLICALHCWIFCTQVSPTHSLVYMSTAYLPRFAMAIVVE